MPRPEPSPASRAPLRRFGLAIAAAMLTTVFVVRGFPYDLLARRIEAAFERATGFELELGELHPRLSPFGPGVEATAVRLSEPGGGALRIERLRIRPAWSLGWLRLRPAFRIAADLAGGSVDGTLAVGPAFAGEIGALELEALPLAALWPGASFGGRLDASLDVQAAEGRPVGSLTLRARQGSATLPQLPMPLAFESLEARIALGTDSALVQVEELTLAGPGLVARVTGSLGHASSFVEAPLDLGIELEVDAALRAPLQGLGVRLRPDGRGRLRVTGTGANPQVE